VVLLLNFKEIYNPRPIQIQQNLLKSESSPMLSSGARLRTGSDWIRTEVNFSQTRTGSDCNFFEN